MNRLSPNDLVPKLRGDVVFSRRPTGTGAEVIHIRPIGHGESTRLHGFELSLARLLDGRRTAEDVVGRANRIGLPLSLSALDAFIRHLQGHGLLARSAGEASSPVSPWSLRDEWDEGVRMQFQAALKALRRGDVQHTRDLLDRLLATAPALEEARALRAWLDQNPDGVGAEPFVRTWSRAESEWLKVPAPPRASPPLERAELRSVRRSWVPMVVLGLVLAAGLAALLLPLPEVVSAPGRLDPIAVTRVEVPRDAVVQRVHVAEGQWVRAGEPLVTFEGGEGITAPTEGRVADVFVREGGHSRQGQQLLRLEDTRQLRLTATLDPVQAAEVREGQTATIALGAYRAKTTVNAVSSETVVTTLDNSAGRMEPGDAIVDIDVGSESLLKRVLR
ncbi:MAG: HlyD family efflux transporter periplasmic adaptor subunit [Myxococcaceae bacterium]|nr:HlyD family efflux transporter periplasmic adaptor subunit [Myxococcaceae bacterium]